MVEKIILVKTFYDVKEYLMFKLKILFIKLFTNIILIFKNSFF